MRRLSKKHDFDRIIVPGKFRGDLDKLSNFFKVPVERGPDDVSNIPDYFGMKMVEDKLSEYECEIFAEIVDAAILSPSEIFRIAKDYVKDGANIIDIGCMPDTKFDHLEEVIKGLKAMGIKVSVDSANDEELIRGSKAGADYVLSISEKNLHIMNNINSIPVLIPAKQGQLKSLERIINIMKKKKQDFIADPILDPIHYGFARSIDRYIKLRKKFPDIKILMGTGNLTELTDCDSVGTNTILMGLVSELSINAVLVVQVSNHCKNSIKETDAARKIMHFSKKNQRLPFRVNNNLMCISDRKPKENHTREIKEIKSMVKDKNFRIFLAEDGINVFNSQTFTKGYDPYDFFEGMKVDNDASHAFYLGIELARAQIAYQLGKDYDQDNELKWGIAVKTKKQNLLKRPELKITQK